LDTFTAIKYSDLGIYAAVVDLQTGILQLNDEYWDLLPDHLQRWILLHEKGHLENGNKDAKSANDYADQHFIDNSSPDAFSESTMQLMQIHRDYLAEGAEKDLMIKKAQGRQKLEENQAGEIVTAIVGAVVVVAGFVVELFQNSKKKKDQKKLQEKAEVAAINAEVTNQKKAQGNNLTIAIGIGILAVILVGYVMVVK
jgi:hypothetical protein